MSAKYKFDGVKLKKGSTVVANVRGDQIRKGTGSSVVANIRDGKIRKGNGSTVEFNLRGDDIRTGSGSTRIAKMKDVDKDIDGSNHVIKAALWLYFVR